MFGLFWKSSSSQNLNKNESQVDESLVRSKSDLQTASMTLEKREQYLLKQAQEAMVRAKEKNKRGDRKGALMELKRKKMFEKEIEGMYGKRINLESQVNALENAVFNKQILEAMKTGNESMKSHITEKVVEETVDIMGDLDEQLQMIDEISESLAAPISSTATLGDEELDAELQELEALHSEPQLDERVTDFPAVPSQPVVVSKSKEEQELAELEREFELLV